MPKIHVLTQKEVVDPNKLTNCVVVVFDVLLATTTITTLLQHGSKSVIPVRNVYEALEVSKLFPKSSYILSGEINGFAVQDFVYPCPLELREVNLEDKTVILSTTNGTVALNKSRHAPFVYASSILNNASVAKYIAQNEIHDEHSIVLVCSGNKGRFSMEDFIGAGSFIKELLEYSSEEYELSDSARLAYIFYEQCSEEQLLEYFLTSQTGKLLRSLGYSHSIYYSLQHNIFDVVPVLQKGELQFLVNAMIES